MYWAVTALRIMGEELDVLDFILKCYKGTGFSGTIGFDEHLLFTHNALQILVMYNAMHLVDADLICKSVASLQQLDGSFVGDEWGEVDVRFSYCALAVLSFFNKLDLVDCELAANHILKCQNFDGGFGSVPGSESHAAMVFCCVGSLYILKKEFNTKSLVFWLSDRQVESGGCNGRPGKQEDVCYSWWVYASLKMLSSEEVIDKKKLIEFILSMQNKNGGIQPNKGENPDLFHTMFGLAALSLLEYSGLKQVSPVYCIT